MDVLIYSICLGVGLLFTIIGAVAGHLFGGHGADSDVGTGGHAEAGFDHTGMPGVSPFSPTMIAAFVTSFGALGIIFSKIEATSKPLISAPLSAVGGLAIAAGVFTLFQKVFSKTQSSSESHVASLVGQEATVITPIPENSVGEIAYVQAGTRYTAPARAENGVPIAAGRSVKITRTVGSQFYVEKGS
jgi:membrane-bound ClpP family serine protease